MISTSFAASPSALAVVPSGQTPGPRSQQQIEDLNDRLKSEVSVYKVAAVAGFSLTAILAVGLVVQKLTQNQRIVIARAEGATMGFPRSPYGQPPHYQQPGYQPPYQQPAPYNAQGGYR